MPHGSTTIDDDETPVIEASAGTEPAAPDVPPPPQLLNLICVKVLWEGSTPVQSMAGPFHDVLVRREAEYPKGRKGLTLARAWEQMQTEQDAGLLLVDGDVVIDPVDLTAMIGHVASDRASVWTAPVKLWPNSTHMSSWVWGHRKPPPPGATQDEVMRLWQADIEDPLWFTFCFTYLPRALVELAINSGMSTWCYPNVDKNMHELAARAGFGVRVVRGDCHPKHINFR